MADYGVPITVIYTAWDTSANGPKTGDAANHTIYLIKDGTAAAATNSPAEVDATNCKGEYKITLTFAEMLFNVVVVCGVSGTSNVVIIPLKITTRRFGAGDGARTKVLYVRKGGSDSNGGYSPQTGFLTIPYGISQLSAGETLHVGPGAYSGSALVLDNPGHNLCKLIFDSVTYTVSSGTGLTIDADDCTLIGKGPPFYIQANDGAGVVLNGTWNILTNFFVRPFSGSLPRDEIAYDIQDRSFLTKCIAADATIGFRLAASGTHMSGCSAGGVGVAGVSIDSVAECHVLNFIYHDLIDGAVGIRLTGTARKNVIVNPAGVGLSTDSNTRSVTMASGTTNNLVVAGGEAGGLDRADFVDLGTGNRWVRNDPINIATEGMNISSDNE